MTIPNENHKTVAIITPTTGRASLRRTIESVRKQTYPCKHYIFVDGEQFHAATQEIVKDYPEVIVTYLPMNTGGDERKLLNSVVNAVGPYVVKEDYICYLDDDNWYDEQHVASLIDILQQTQADFAFNLRYMVDEHEQVICRDNFESLGFWSFQELKFTLQFFNDHGKHVQCDKLAVSHVKEGLIDTNCYMLKTELAQELSQVWVKHGMVNDRNITKYLLNRCTEGKAGVCTGQRTVYYYVDLKKSSYRLSDMNERKELCVEQEETYLQFLRNSIIGLNQSVEQHTDEQGKLPWQYVTMLKDGELSRLV